MDEWCGIAGYGYGFGPQLKKEWQKDEGNS